MHTHALAFNQLPESSNLINLAEFGRGSWDGLRIILDFVYKLRNDVTPFKDAKKFHSFRSRFTFHFMLVGQQGMVYLKKKLYEQADYSNRKIVLGVFHH